jgi:multiple sugar transport system substrate-binding protein
MNLHTLRVIALALAAWACGTDERGPLRLSTGPRGAESTVEDQVLESFAAAHPGVAVARVSTAPADVIRLDEDDIAAVLARGGALDLTPYLARAGVGLAAYDAPVLDLFRRDDRVYALPRGYSPIVLAYNKDLFDRVGLSYPSDDWTWDDFLAAAVQLTQDSDGDGTIDRWGTYFDPRVTVWLPWVRSGGGEVLCADADRASGCLDAPATRAALRWLTDWVGRDGVAAPPTGVTGPPFRESLRLFAEGRIAMATADHSWVPALRHWAEKRGPRAGFALIPHRAGFESATAFSASAYAVSPTTLRRKLAVELAAALTDSAAQQQAEDAGFELPAVPRGVRELAASDTLGWEAVFARAQASARAPWGARVGPWREAAAVLRGMVERIVAGAEPDGAARDAAGTLDRLIGSGR